MLKQLWSNLINDVFFSNTLLYTEGLEPQLLKSDCLLEVWILLNLYSAINLNDLVQTIELNKNS